ncbi:SDR family NAD(P)-dependent oxidoreductase [Skermania piniformis]|uniref:SDR family NAD(P)-dependent oxidoreductase n=1 Tax=Skermania pinensis TaxID=39122 RepID=A0ABX8SGE7_9ACTN|nr:SDR family NAD(P)-dependent oxidoreductase [Skermania piniformis]QXQ15510.1 SDR family NAD(P)-dependent oxidoreductase [Skermania piniformis]
MPNYSLAGRTVAITGSTGGLGTALATELRSRGANLALIARNIDAVQSQASQLGGPETARGFSADVGDLDALETAMAAAADHFGRLDVVIANAGIESVESMLGGDPGNFERLIDINLVGTWRTFRAGAPHVIEQQGHLLAISSMAAFIHSPLQAAYTASKAGVWAMCDAIRLELRHTGVTVGTIHPTFFDTPLMDEVQANPAARALWGEHKKAPWKLIPRELVVTETVDAIERRADITTVPRVLAAAAGTPILSRMLMNRVSFSDATVKTALALADTPTPGSPS